MPARISSGRAVVDFCRRASVRNSPASTASRQRLAPSDRRSEKTMKFRARNSAVVSIRKARPQNRYNGVDRNSAAKSQKYSGAAAPKSLRKIAWAGTRHAIQNP
jgi:hypothetical protein